MSRLKSINVRELPLTLPLVSRSLAAHRAGMKSKLSENQDRSRVCLLTIPHPVSTELIVPAACKSDIDENVPPSVKEGIEFVFVDDARQVLHEVFANEPLLKRLQEHLPLENGEPVRTKH